VKYFCALNPEGGMIVKNRAILVMVTAMLALCAGVAYSQSQAQQPAQPPAQQQDEGPILRPKTPPAKPAVPTLQVTCDLACNWSLDGEDKGHIDAGATVKAKVSAGQHTVAAETEDALDEAENEIKIKISGQNMAHIWLQPVRDARLKAEQEAKDKAAQEEKAKADQEARDKALQEERDRASREAQAKAEQDARDKAFIAARDKASQEAQAKAEKEAHDKAVRDEWERERRERMRSAPLDNTGGVWIDPATGLMWTRKDNGFALRWQPAAEYCRSLGLGGYTDWRLPSIEELRGIFNPNAAVACGPNGNMSCQIKGRIQLTSSVVWSNSRGERPQFMRGFVFRDTGEPRKHVVELDKRGASFDRALCVRNSGQ
jgi:hypothetical protein